MALRQRSYLERFFASQYGQSLVSAYVALLVGVGGLWWTEHPDAATFTFCVGMPLVAFVFWVYAVWTWVKGFPTQKRTQVFRRIRTFGYLAVCCAVAIINNW